MSEPSGPPSHDGGFEASPQICVERSPAQSKSCVNETSLGALDVPAQSRRASSSHEARSKPPPHPAPPCRVHRSITVASHHCCSVTPNGSPRPPWHDSGSEVRASHDRAPMAPSQARCSASVTPEPPSPSRAQSSSAVRAQSTLARLHAFARSHAASAVRRQRSSLGMPVSGTPASPVGGPPGVHGPQHAGASARSQPWSEIASRQAARSSRDQPLAPLPTDAQVARDSVGHADASPSEQVAACPQRAS